MDYVRYFLRLPVGAVAARPLSLNRRCEGGHGTGSPANLEGSHVGIGSIGRISTNELAQHPAGRPGCSGPVARRKTVANATDPSGRWINRARRSAANGSG